MSIYFNSKSETPPAEVAKAEDTKTPQPQEER